MPKLKKQIMPTNIEKLKGYIQLLKVNFKWDSERDNHFLINSKQDYLEWITEIQELAKTIDNK